jgi:polysaccharide biosynthesis/export protein
MILLRKPWLFPIFFVLLSGCATARPCCLPDVGTSPSETNKAAIPEYHIAPPDILLIDAVRLVPRPPYHIAPLDALIIKVTVLGGKEGAKDEILPGEPIDSIYRVEPDGTVNLGPKYKSVSIVGQTLPEAKETITSYLLKRFQKVDIEVLVTLAEAQNLQQIRGQHLVHCDGKITLGSYGSVFVAGMTPEQAKAAIVSFLSPKLLEPEISLDVVGFNSMVYYVIFDLPGSAESIARLPYTGNETVLDAIAEVRGLPPGIDRARMWVARPTSPEEGCDKILPVDWKALTQRGATATNYQLLPGDRVFVALDPLVETDSFLAKVLAPVERVFNIILLGNSTIQQFKTNNGTSGGI